MCFQILVEATDLSVVVLLAEYSTYMYITYLHGFLQCLVGFTVHDTRQQCVHRDCYSALLVFFGIHLEAGLTLHCEVHRNCHWHSNP